MIEFVFDLQRFAKSGNGKTGFDALELMHNIIQRFDLKASGNSTLQFIGTFYGSLFFKKSSRDSQTGALTTILGGIVSLVEDVYTIREENAKDNPSKEVITSKAGDFVSKLMSLKNAFEKLNGGKNSFILSVVSSAVGLASNLVLGMNGLEEDELEKINKSYVALVKVSGAEIIKKFFSAGLADKFIKMPVSQILDNPTVKAEIRKQTAANFTKGSGQLGLIFAAITGILNGANKYDNNLKKYTDDGIPEDIAKHEAVIDALATFIHDTASNYAKGFDDTVFKWVQSAISYVTGKDIPYYTDKNYVEVIADQFKTLNYKNSGTSSDDSQETFIVSVKNKSYIYGDNGNDSIQNVASNVTIWGGHDNDTIWSVKHESKTPARNSIFGGPGNDFVAVQDTQSTIYGGKGNDFLLTQGTKNIIYGDAGNDSIVIDAIATGNSIYGGLGDDLIFIESGAKKNKFFYTSGDGNDTIYNFGASDSLTVSGKFFTVKSGSDIKVKVGKGSILLVGATDKKIYINGNVLNDEPISSGTFTPIPYPTLPSAPESPLISGTSGDDRIENFRSNVLINAGKANDSVFNGLDNWDGGWTDGSWIAGGSKVTINGGNGNDYIKNLSGSFNSINGGAGNDSIRNEGNHNLIIDGGLDNDYIYSRGSNNTINGGDGDDSIYNRWGENLSINSGAGNDSIYSSDDSVTIEAGAGNDSIYSSDSQVIIDGGSGNDSIVNYEGDYVTINGGDGNDTINLIPYASNNVIKYQSGDGNDSIKGFNSDDTLQIGGGTGTYFSKRSGDDLIVTVGKGKITLQVAANLSTLNIDGVWKDPTLLTVTNSTKSPVKVSSAIKTVDASARTKAVQITGNKQANTIIGGLKNDSIVGNAGNDKIFGGKGNDCIIGGKGNDSLWGDAGADKFFYAKGDGKDIIFGFDRRDTLTLDNLDFTSSYKNEILTLKVDGGSVTLKEFTATTFNINDASYKISGSKLVKK